MRWFAFLLTSALAFGAAPQRVSLSNRYLERTFEISENRVRTVSLYNRLDHRLYPVDSQEFELTLIQEARWFAPGQENPVRLTGDDFLLRGFDKTGDSLTFHLTNKLFHLDIDMVVRLAPNDFYLRKWLEIRSTDGFVQFLDHIAVEKFSIAGVKSEHGGFGQPVYADSLFYGLEYPASYDGRSYYSGESTGPRPLRTESAVVGVAGEGGTRAAFLEYIDRIRSGRVRPVTVFNTWYDMQGDTLTDSNSRARMATLKSELLDPYQIPLDSFVLDDGWDDYQTPWQIHQRRFGGDFSALDRSLRGQGTALGLWFGPFGGYAEGVRLRIEAARKLGWEVTANGRALCLAGRNYHQKFKQVVLEMVRKYHVNHFKFDGVPYGCNDPNHGHLVGVYSREADLRAFVDILKSIRAADPHVFLNITTGNWLSPWWLMYADVVFMGGLDYGFLNDVPAVSERDKAITYRDKVLYDDFRKYAFQFPHNSLMTIGIIKGTLGGEGGLEESLETWVNNAIMNFSRGSMMTELYISPGIMKPEEWRTLGEITRWARANSDVLLGDARFIGGDPGERQIYGYSHFKGGRGIVTLRNPVIEPQSFALPIDTRGEHAYHARVIFPYSEQLPGTFRYGDSVPLALDGFETKVIEFSPGEGAPSPASESAPSPVVSGLRIDDRAGSFDLTIPAGRAARLAILCEGASALKPELRRDGQPLQVATASPQSTEKGLGVGGGTWTFLVAPVPAGHSHIDFKVAGAAKASAWVLTDFKIGKPVIPAPAARERHTTHLFTRQW
jgi:hypothetical protein